MATYQFRYKETQFPDIKLGKIVAENEQMAVWFSWRDAPQWCYMEKETDGHFLIWQTNYTDAFQDWLDENLHDYDSLEATFTNEMEKTK